MGAAAVDTLIVMGLGEAKRKGDSEVFRVSARRASDGRRTCSFQDSSRSGCITEHTLKGHLAWPLLTAPGTDSAFDVNLSSLSSVSHPFLPPPSSNCHPSFLHLPFQLPTGIKLTLSALLDGKNVNAGGHKLGLGLEFQA